MRRMTVALGSLTDRGRNCFRREWHSVVLTVGVAVLVPAFAISVLALPPATVERIAGPVLGSTLVGAQLPALESPSDRTSPSEAVALERAEAGAQRPGRYTAAQGSIRFSLGRYNTEDEIEQTLSVLPSVINRLAEMSPIK